MEKKLPANAGGTGLIPGSGRSPGGGHSNQLQYSCLENPMDRGAWKAIVHEITESGTTKQQQPEYLLTFKRGGHIVQLSPQDTLAHNLTLPLQ